MSLSDSTFLLDLSVEQIKHLDRKEFRCQVNFADLVKSYLLDLKELEYAVSTGPIRREKSKKKRILCYRGLRKEFGQTLVLKNKDNQIVLSMEKHNLEVSLWSKSHPDVKIGTSIIPWTQNFYNYFKNISKSPRLPPMVHKGVYNVANAQQNRLGSIIITIKLVCTSSNFYRYITSSKSNVSIYRHLFSNPDVIVKLFHTIKRNNNSRAIEKNKLELENGILESIKQDTKQSAVEMNKANMLKEEYDFLEDPEINPSFVNTRTMIKQYQCNEIINEKKYNAFDYIFGDPNECFKDRVYCVNYFTVNINKSIRSDTSIKSSGQNKRLNFRNSQCLHKTESDNNITIKHSLDVPPDVTSSFKLIKCKEISCNSRVHRKSPIFTNATTALDFTNIHKECCTIIQEYKGKTEAVLGEVSAKMNNGEDQCYCSCECRFSSIKPTRYCKVCGGYEIAGDDLMNKIALDMPMPCPVFHKLVDKNKLKTWSTSGSESRSKASKVKGDDSLKSIKSSTKAASDKRLSVSDKKNVKSEKDSKKENNVIKRHRNQFTYAYKAPHIGHDHCVLPCTGTLNNVPKSMGWFWTADDSPGSRISKGWKPGAVSKHLFRKLKRAELQTSIINERKLKRRKKKHVENKPTLKINKFNGIYRIEMHDTSKSNEEKSIEHTPIVYKLENLHHKVNKIKKKQQQAEIIEKVMTDAYDNALCDGEYLMVNNKDLALYDENVHTSAASFTTEKITSCSSSDLEWEIHFTPPIAKYTRSK